MNNKILTNLIVFSTLLVCFLLVVQPLKSAELPKEIIGKDGVKMVLIPAGEFLMGSPEGEGRPQEHPRHKIYLDAYYIDKCEITVAQYKKFCEMTGRRMPILPSWSKENHPIIKVDWTDAVAYARYFNERLPTEAEWEKACCADSATNYSFGDSKTKLGEYAWYHDNSAHKTHPVGSKKPNAFGVYDMHGSVFEWCSDWFNIPDIDNATTYYSRSPFRNPQGPSSGQYRVKRGGSWYSGSDSCRCASRSYSDPSYGFSDYGFRCVLPAGAK